MGIDHYGQSLLVEPAEEVEYEGWLIDRRMPDRWDWMGGAMCLVGVAVIMWMPRDQSSG